jgi:hypothetical protein
MTTKNEKVEDAMTLTAERTETTADTKETDDAPRAGLPDQEPCPSLGRRLLDDLKGANKPKGRATKEKHWAKAGFIRASILLFDWLLVFTTATSLVPAVGAWLHMKSGAAGPGVGVDGLIAVWLVPLLFIVGMLMIGEVAIMRALWQAGRRKIERMRAQLESEADGPERVGPGRETTTTSSGSKQRNRKRRK